MHTILVLGGYGFFGARISASLAATEGVRLLIGGRNGNAARYCAAQLGLGRGSDVALDACAPDLAERLMQLGIDTVIHTAGPFQGQDYAVARAAIAAGANYIDLADGRAFVAGIEQLDALARERSVFVCSGASSLPALSSAVVDRYFGRFLTLDAIRIGIGSGARAPGIATMRGVFGYAGKAFNVWREGCWTPAYGWLGLVRHRFPDPVGARWLGNCDVPDLVLFPRRYPGVRTVTFQAGFASATGHLVIWAAAQLVRLGLLRSLTPLAAPLHAISTRVEGLVSDKGGMFVTLTGSAAGGAALKLEWHLVAAQNHGPFIPCGAAIALARKLARGERLPHGAMPCMGLLTVEDYLGALAGYDVRELAP